MVWGWWLGLFLSGFPFSMDCGFIVLFNVGGSDEVVYAEACSLNVSAAIGTLKSCAVGDGFHALHWNIFSWLGCCVVVFRCLTVVCLFLYLVVAWILCFWRLGGV